MNKKLLLLPFLAMSILTMASCGNNDDPIDDFDIFVPPEEPETFGGFRRLKSMPVDGKEYKLNVFQTNVDGTMVFMNGKAHYDNATYPFFFDGNPYAVTDTPDLKNDGCVSVKVKYIDKDDGSGRQYFNLQIVDGTGSGNYYDSVEGNPSYIYLYGAQTSNVKENTASIQCAPIGKCWDMKVEGEGKKDFTLNRVDLDTPVENGDGYEGKYTLSFSGEEDIVFTLDGKAKAKFEGDQKDYAYTLTAEYVSVQKGDRKYIIKKDNNVFTAYSVWGSGYSNVRVGLVDATENETFDFYWQDNAFETGDSWILGDYIDKYARDDEHKNCTGGLGTHGKYLKIEGETSSSIIKKASMPARLWEEIVEE